MRYCLLLAALLSVSMAYVPESFRMQSTAGIWDDDYDVILDPARTLEVQGSRLYTNLANYVTGNENHFGLNTNNFFLIGGSSNLKGKYGPAGVFDRYSFRLPQFTGLFDPLTGDSLTGSTRLDSVQWQDLDTNGTYDFKRVSRTERNAWSSGEGNNLYLGCGLAVRKHVFGVAFAWDDSIRAEVYPGGDFIYHRYDSSLVAGRLTYLMDDTSQQCSHSCYDRKRIVLSARLALPASLTLGLNFQPSLINRGYDATWIENGRTDRNPGGPGIEDYDLLTLRDSLLYPWHGFVLPLTAELVQTRVGNAETRVCLGGFYRREAADTGYGETYARDYFTTLDPGQEHDNYLMTWKRRGTSAAGGLNVRLLRRHWLGERFDLGWGAAFALVSSSDSSVESGSQRSTVSYDDGDSLPTRNDYVQTYTASESWLNRDAGVQASLAIPVGLEFRPVSQIALRLGATPTFALDNGVTTSELLAITPPKTRIDYGDGTYSEFVGEIQRNPNSSSAYRRFTQTTTFSYGLGIRPIDNLQLDLMGFANLTNLANWRLSATFRF